GSHYLALQMLEGFMEREAIKVVHMGQARLRLEGMLDGTVDAAMLMEPFIAAAEKLDCTLVMEGFYAGSEMLAPDLDAATVRSINTALTRAVDLINADKKKYLPHIMADAPSDLVKLTPEDFKVSRLRYVHPRPYPEDEFTHTYEWMRSWDLIPEGATYESLVDNRVAAG
ncbi:MAG: ABC transporter substrate-binding protein, partial [Dehalococcoidia bacterium]